MSRTTSIVLLGLSFGCADSEVARRYEDHCAPCHATGASDAPKKGDAATWKRRLIKGEDVLFESVRDGRVGMPPRGRCPTCSDEQLRELIRYMVR